MAIPNLGPKFVSGSASTGRVVAARDDGTVDHLPVLMFIGAINDVTSDGVFDLNFPGGS